MGTLANSEDPDEMPQTAAFHQCLHCLLRQNGYGYYTQQKGTMFPMNYTHLDSIQFL